MSRMRVTRWLQSPLVSGPPAILCAVGAVLVPTLVRYSVNGVLLGCEFTPYLPFVLLSAVFLRWWQAAMVALTCVVLFGGLFLGDHHLTDPCVQSSMGMFLASSALIIGTVMLLRHAVAGLLSSPDESSNTVIFSMEQGQVWATLPGKGPPVCLGSQNNVHEMMEDFLAQNELAKRLHGHSD